MNGSNGNQNDKWPFHNKWSFVIFYIVIFFKYSAPKILLHELLLGGVTTHPHTFMTQHMNAESQKDSSEKLIVKFFTVGPCLGLSVLMDLREGIL